MSLNSYPLIKQPPSPTLEVTGFDGSIFSRNPEIYSLFGADTAGLVVNANPLDSGICKLWVDGFRSGVKFPQGFLPTAATGFESLVGSTSGMLNENSPYIRFMIDTVQLNLTETVMPIKNLNEGFTTYVFGQEPPVFNFSGVLMHTKMDNWDELFLMIYQYVIRATKLAELSVFNKKKYSVVLTYQNKKLYGSIINLGQATSAQNEQGVRFNFNFLVKRIDLIDWARVTGISQSNLELASVSKPMQDYDFCSIPEIVSPTNNTMLSGTVNALNDGSRV